MPKYWTYNVGDDVKVNDNALANMPDDVGKDGVIDKLLDNRYDYRVKFGKDDYGIFNENELNLLKKNDSIHIKQFVKVKSNNKMGKVETVLYKLNQVELKYGDGAYDVISLDDVIPMTKSEIKKYQNKIVLTGHIRSGKDTVAEYMVDKYQFKRFAFADSLKHYYHELFGYSNGKPRTGYQWFGQAMRERDPEIWIRKCFEQINNVPYENIVITDLRLQNEYQKCKQEGFTIVRVECDDDLRMKRILEKNDQFNMNDLLHETEKHIDTFKVDYVIKNNDGLDSLYEQIENILSLINGRCNNE